MEANTVKTSFRAKGTSFRANRTSYIVKTGIMAAIAFILMYIEIGIPIVPPWLKLDISDFPALLAGFSLGPVSGIIVQAIKALLFFLLKNSGTGGVGEIANLLMGIAFVLPAALIYMKNKSFKRAIFGTLVGVVSMTLASGLLNYYLLIPAYAQIMPMEAILSACTLINPAMNSVEAYVFMAAMPFTFAKGLLDGIIIFLIYKRVSPVLHK